MRRTYILLLAALLCGCQLIERKHQPGVAVELNGHYLSSASLDSLTFGLHSEDSARVVEQYIRQWAQDILLFDAAKAQTNSEIEALVDAYRRSLYVHAYEEFLASREMSHEVSDSAVQEIYTRLSDRFLLRESIVKGLLLVVPNDAPNLKKLRQWLMQSVDENIDEIEKYAYQNASGYELFTDHWKTASELQLQMPFERDNFDALLRKQSHIEISDSVKTYILQLTDKHLRGEQMPIEYAHREIEAYILTDRQVEFLRHKREQLYDEAVQQHKILFFNNEQ